MIPSTAQSKENDCEVIKETVNDLDQVGSKFDFFEDLNFTH